MANLDKIKNSPYTGGALAFAAGAMLPLSLSPSDYWPFAFLAPALLFLATFRADLKATLVRIYLFNVGMFATGVSWIFVSVNVYGGASSLLAGSLVVLLVLSWSLICLPHAWLYHRLRNGASGVLLFAALWTLQEWFRGWFLTGFPWLYLGYGAMETWFVNLAPAFGVFAVGFAVCLFSVALTALVVERRYLLIVLPVSVCLLALAIKFVPMTSPGDDTVSVSLVQANIDQHTKWRPENRVRIINRYLGASESEWGRDLIIWPEAAITIFVQDAGSLLDDLNEVARAEGSTLITGIPDLDVDGGFQNTVVALGEGEGQYIKRRLVPFGEYVPLEFMLRGVIRLFNLPMSRNKPGPDEQLLLTAGDLVLATSICYEVVYPELVREEADLLVTVSNDTWFGESIGPWQHLQMARMRALENGRSMVRATNNGVTAVIDASGQITASLPQFTEGVLRADAEIRRGQTWFNRFGHWPVLLVCLGLMVVPVYRSISTLARSDGQS